LQNLLVEPKVDMYTLFLSRTPPRSTISLPCPVPVPCPPPPAAPPWNVARPPPASQSRRSGQGFLPYPAMGRRPPLPDDVAGDAMDLRRMAGREASSSRAGVDKPSRSLPTTAGFELGGPGSVAIQDVLDPLCSWKISSYFFSLEDLIWFLDESHVHAYWIR
jgi:hypothetical protein